MLLWLSLRAQSCSHIFRSGCHKGRLPCGSEPGAEGGWGSARPVPPQPGPVPQHPAREQPRQPKALWPPSRATVMEQVQKAYYPLRDWWITLRKHSCRFLLSIFCFSKENWREHAKSTDSLKEKIHFRRRCCQNSLAVSECQQPAYLT